MFEVAWNLANASAVLDALWDVDELAAELIDDTIEAIAAEPARFEVEQTESGSFIVQVPPTPWFIMWAYAPTPQLIVVGRSADSSKFSLP